VRRSVASLDCLAVSVAQSKILERIGSAFLISGGGEFLTAAHVVMNMQKREPLCPTPALVLPTVDWRPEARTEQMLWLPFTMSSCRVDSSLDLAVCPLADVPARVREHLKIAAVQFEWHIQPDGTQVAFTGFPLAARDPMTFRGNVAAYRMPWPDKPIPELVLDRAALPGFSGSPVYLADGSVIGILVEVGKNEANGITIARPASVIRKLVEGK
jgi:hypothetical protein